MFKCPCVCGCGVLAPRQMPTGCGFCRAGYHAPRPAGDPAAAVERVRDLHSMRESLVYADGVCRECAVQYPCPTVIALDVSQ